MKWPYRAIFRDVIGRNKVWLKSWGNTRPTLDSDKEKIFAKWFEIAPKLTPIAGHRFVVNGSNS